LARHLASLPQQCLRNDRRSAYEQWGLSETDALVNEFRLGLATLSSGESVAGATRFKQGVGRGGTL
jgi:enoyl-CoA hydratase